jgi:CheY-like chemotaxis protein/anti-sigma regulatory factor (Ser/Thr protein kinase)
MSANPSARDSTKEKSSSHTVLIVDDAAMDRHLAGAIVQKLPGWTAMFANDGADALASLLKQQPDIVLTDMLMPEMNGLELVQAIRAKHPLIPVILMTAHGSEALAIDALKSGAASYVPKQVLAKELPETLEQVLSASQTKIQEQQILSRLVHFESRFVFENDTSLIPALVAQLEADLTRLKVCEPGGLVLLGVALHEALTNAMLHGNLELSSILRETNEKEYYRLAVERRTLDPFADRRIFVTTRFTSEEAAFVIRDEGPGFDPALLPDPTDPANLDKVSGRGLLLIRTFMDRVDHNDAGNEITMVKHRKTSEVPETSEVLV